MEALASRGIADSEREWILYAVATFAKRRMLFLLVFFATVMGAYGVGQLQTELYEIEASVLVKLGRENVEVPATVQKGSVLSAGVRAEQLNSEMHMLSSRSLIEAVVDRIGLDAFHPATPQPQTFLQRVKFYTKQGVRWGKAQLQSFLIVTNLKKELTEREKVILDIESTLVVEVARDSDVINVRLQYPNADLSVRILDVLLQLYLDHHIQVWRDEDVKDFFEAEIVKRRQDLQNIEQAKEEIKAKWNLISMAEQRTLLLQQLQELHNQIAAHETNKSMLQAQRATIQTRLRGLQDELHASRVIKPNPAIQSTKERLTALRQEHAKLVTLYEPASQRVQNITKEIAALEALLAREDSTLVDSATFEANPLKQQLSQELEKLEVNFAGLDSAIRQLRLQTTAIATKLEFLNTGERQLVTIERERQIAEQNYLAYVKRGEESLMSEELDRRRIANIAILSPPSKPLTPVYPRKLLMMAISVPMGLLFGSALVVLVEYMNDIISTPRDLAGINGLAYLGSFRVQGAQSTQSHPAKATRAKIATTRHD